MASRRNGIGPRRRRAYRDAIDELPSGTRAMIRNIEREIATFDRRSATNSMEKFEGFQRVQAALGPLAHQMMYRDRLSRDVYGEQYERLRADMMRIYRRKREEESSWR